MTIAIKRDERYFLNIDGTEVEIVKTNTDKEGRTWLVLPENPEHRKYLCTNLFKNKSEVTLSAINRNPTLDEHGKPISARGVKRVVVNIPENFYSELPEDDAKALAMAAKTISEINARYLEAHAPKPKTEEEKLRERIEKLQAELEKLREKA